MYYSVEQNSKQIKPEWAYENYGRPQKNPYRRVSLPVRRGPTPRRNESESSIDVKEFS